MVWVTILFTVNSVFAQSSFMDGSFVLPQDSSPRVSGQPPTANRGTGGGTMQDCGIQPGPVAYNIGRPNGSGIGQDCRPRSVVVGFQGSFSSLPPGTIGMGYINPRIENRSMLVKFPGSTGSGGDEWDEPIYYDYNSKGAVDYITYQVNHWKAEGRKRGQKCVAVDVDNCDVIKAGEYGKVLDTIDRLNRQSPDVQIRVLIKNPQNAGCGQHLRRPIAVGAFMEELSQSDFNRLASLRANTNQMMIFARGNNRGAGHISMDAIARSGLPNSTVSFDSNGSYQQVSKCTYNGGGGSPGSNGPLLTGDANR